MYRLQGKGCLGRQRKRQKAKEGQEMLLVPEVKMMIMILKLG